MKRILGAYEKEEITNSLIKQETREQTLNTMIRIFAWLAVIAFLLILFFTFFILRDLSRSQRYRKELEAANRYADQLLKSQGKDDPDRHTRHQITAKLCNRLYRLLNNTPINERQRYFLKNMRGSSEHIPGNCAVTCWTYRNWKTIKCPSSISCSIRIIYSRKLRTILCHWQQPNIWN